MKIKNTVIALRAAKDRFVREMGEVWLPAKVCKRKEGKPGVNAKSEKRGASNTPEENTPERRKDSFDAKKAEKRRRRTSTPTLADMAIKEDERKRQDSLNQT